MDRLDLAGYDLLVARLYPFLHLLPSPSWMTACFRLLSLNQVGLGKELGICTPSSDPAEARICSNLRDPVEGTGSQHCVGRS